MASVEESVERVSAFLANRLSPELFEDWSASYVSAIGSHDDSDGAKVARLIRSILNAYEEDETDLAMRAELAETIRPFVKPFSENRYGDSSCVPVSRSYTEPAMNAAA